MGLIREGELNQGRGWGSREREAVGERVWNWDSGDLGLVVTQTSPFSSSLNFSLSLHNRRLSPPQYRGWDYIRDFQPGYSRI